MSLNLSVVDQLVIHLDTGKGLFCESRDQLATDRMLSSEFVVVNAAGEPLLVNAATVYAYQQLIGPIAAPAAGGMHPIEVLNRFWTLVKGTTIVADGSTVAKFTMTLLEDRIDLQIVDKSGDAMSTSIACGISTRMLALRVFCEIDASLHDAIVNWIGKSVITYDTEGDGNFTIVGLPLLEVAPAPAPAKVAKAPAAKKPARAAAPAKPTKAPAVAKPATKPARTTKA